MSTTLLAIVGSNSYNLTDGSISWRILDDGLAMAPTRRLEERGPLQHGVTDLGFRLDPRIIHLTLKTQGTTLADLYNRRKALINIFKPLTNTPVQLRYGLDNGDIRQIDCYTVGQMEMSEKDRQGFLQTLVLTLKAPDPLFYDPNQVVYTWNYRTTGSPFNVPLAVPVTVGAGPAINDNFSFTYQGNFASYPVITLRGPLANPYIVNQTTGDRLIFPNFNLPGGYSVTIDCRFGYKTITDSNGVNQIAGLSSDSNLATFKIDNGINSLLVGTEVRDSTAPDTGASISFFNRYMGI